jgi:hypothetical protein
MSTNLIRRIRPLEEPLGLFYRPGHSDHKLLSQLLSEAQTLMTGAVFDAQNTGLHEELRKELNRRSLHSVLDPKFLEMATPGGFTKALRGLGWAGTSPDRLVDFEGNGRARKIEALAQFTVSNEYSAILAPTHFLAAGGADPWFAIDLELTRLLRQRLDALGGSDIHIYYPLAIPTKIFFDPAQRQYFKTFLRDLPIKSIWLRVSPFGGKSGHVTLTQYIRVCKDLRDLHTALVAEKSGLLALSLLAFNAVSGVEVGVSSGEKFDYTRLRHEPEDSGGFAPHREVYFPDLGIFLARRETRGLFENRSLRTQLVCRNTACCARGSDDMITDTRRHFVLTRMNEIKHLGLVPLAMRPTRFLDETLRPATDRLGRSGQWEIPKALKEKLERERRRLFGWQQTLGEMARSEPVGESVVLPTRRAARGAR